MTHPTHQYRANIEIGARAAQKWGATTRQIDMMVALAQGSGDYNMDASRLTKAEASAIIDWQIAAGVKPDWTVHAKPVFVPAPRRIKARKVEASVEIPADARRVRHVKLGEGSVIAEDDKAVTVLFDGQKKPARIAPSFLTAA